MTTLHRLLFPLTLALATTATAQPQPVPAPSSASTTLDAATARRIDTIANDVLDRTNTPSASIAVVRDGQLVYTQAYGHARLAPQAIPARPAMRYAIGSISKQFTVAALLLLEQDGKLALDDKVSQYLPKLTRAGDITVRQLLNHTSGYQDYWPHDYTFQQMLAPTTPQAILDTWARRPLDYEPGTRYQYSNTGYVLAGLIVERASGQPLLQFLEQRIFHPLGMTSVIDFDRDPLQHGMVHGYEAYALGPPRAAQPSGPGWLFGAGGLAMTAADLARWNQSLIRQSVLDQTSYATMARDTLLADGTATGYGLGFDVHTVNRHRQLAHDGEVSGYTATNAVYPDDGLAITVLTNLMASKAPEEIEERIAQVLFEHADATDAARAAQAREIFVGLQQGRLDRTRLTPNASAYFSEQALADFQSSLSPLGDPQEFTHLRTWLRGGMTGRSFVVKFPQRKLRVWTYEMPDGKLEQYQVQVMN